MNPSEVVACENTAQRRGESSPARHRYRIRFRKEGLLRFISHNDLLRAWDRLLRRTGLPLKSTEGFHAKTKLSSPIALALGIEGTDEVLDIELTQPYADEELLRRLRQGAVPGLEMVSVESLPTHGVSSIVTAVEYVCRIEGEFAMTDVLGLRDRFLQSPSWIVERCIPGKQPKPIDVRSKLETIAIDGAEIRFRLRVDQGSTVRPEEVLGILGLRQAWLEGRIQIARTRVQLAGHRTPKSRAATPETV